jgi:hypothetical protein
VKSSGSFCVKKIHPSLIKNLNVVFNAGTTGARFMKTFIHAFVLMLLSLSAIASDLLNEKALAKINLDGIQILDESGENTLLWSFKRQARVSQELKDLIARETNTQPISKVWTLATPSRFRNIVIFVGKSVYDDKFQLFVLFVNPSGSTFVLDYDIVAATTHALELENGPSDDIQRYRAVGRGPLF